MQKTMSIRMNEQDYNFVKNLAEENKEEISKAMRELVDLGRLMFAIQSYKNKKISIGKAANLAGISITEMMDLLSKFKIESNIEYEDYLEGLKKIKKIW